MAMSKLRACCLLAGLSAVEGAGTGFLAGAALPDAATAAAATPRVLAESGIFIGKDGGADRVCRGADEGDNSEAYFTVHDGTATLDSCKGSCVGTPGCTGVEYWPQEQRCEVWTASIGASAESPGFECWLYQAATIPAPTPAPALDVGAVEQEEARIPIGGEVRLYAVGSSNVPWNTWFDQLHLALHQLGYATPVIQAQHPDTIYHPTSVPICDDAASYAELETPRIGKIGWASWGFAYEDQDDCNEEGFRPIAGHMVGCTNGWACNPKWTGAGQTFIRPSDIAEDARHSQVTVLSNWINDSKQRHAQNVCYDDENISPVGTTEITLVNLRKVIRAIHARNPDVVIAVMALYPDSLRSTGVIVERTLPQIADINAAVEAGLRDEPNTVWVNYTFPTGEPMFQTFHTGHPNCRGDKVLASSIVEALFREKVLARGLLLATGEEQQTCLTSMACEDLSVACCQRSAFCRLDGAGACVAYSPGEQ